MLAPAQKSEGYKPPVVLTLWRWENRGANALSGMGFFSKNHRKNLRRKDLARLNRSPILAMDNRRDKWEIPHVSPRPLA
jgi:hypothetical protein